MLKNDITYFQHLSQFTSLHDFNNNIEQHMIDHKKTFTKKELIILKRLIRYSAKVYGVSNISIRRLLQAVQQNDNIKLSEATFHRAKRKAVKLGMLTIHSATRMDESQSSNIYVFNRYVNTHKDQSDIKYDIPDDEQQEQPEPTNQQSENDGVTSHEADTNYKTNNILNTRKTDDTMDHTHVSSNIPQPLVQAIQPFFNNADDIYSIYRRLKIATQNYTESLVTHLDDYIKVFKETIHRFKQGSIRSDYFGYLYGAFKRTADHLYMQKTATSGIYFDWLNE